jgi:hypothetical protein
VASHFANHSELSIVKPWWKEIEAQDVETIDGLPNPIVGLPSQPDQPENSGFFSAAVDGYCPVDCQTQFYSLLGFMFVAGLIGASTRLPNTILSLRTIDKRDKVKTLHINVKNWFYCSDNRSDFFKYYTEYEFVLH